MWNADYFSDMSVLDWIGAAVMAPFMVAMLLLLIYLTIGVIGSGPRRRRIANQPPGESEPASDAKPVTTTSRAPGD